jgi:hypothetical protein
MMRLSTASVALTASTLGGATTRCALAAALTKAEGGRGEDHIRAVDGSKDDISCGPGSDRVKANPEDNVAEGCEKVIRAGIRVDYRWFVDVGEARLRLGRA